MSEIIDNDHINILKDKISTKEFENGAVFELDTDNYADALKSVEMEENQSYNKENFADHMDQMPTLFVDDEDTIEAPGSTDFATIALKMTNVTDDGKLKKRVLRPGFGPLAPKTALVEVHYNAYYESSDEAFDSTFLRGQSHKFVPATGDCIKGLCLAVTTMKKGELSRFLIHPDLAYGAMGIPPRIPPAAQTLFEIQLINFIDGVETKSVDELNGQSKEIVDVEKAIAAKHLEGNELFRNKETIREAIAKYNKALTMIDECIQTNSSDFEIYKPRMVTLCANLALCHIKKENYVQAVKICERALTAQPDHCKSLFYYGRALLKMGEYNDAKDKLLKAQKLQPANKEISSEIMKLDVQRNKYIINNKKITEKMFMQSKPENKGIQYTPASKWHMYLSNFKDEKTEAPFVLPGTIPAAEIKEIEADAVRLGLIVSKDKDRVVIKKPKS